MVEDKEQSDHLEEIKNHSKLICQYQDEISHAINELGSLNKFKDKSELAQIRRDQAVKVDLSSSLKNLTKEKRIPTAARNAFFNMSASIANALKGRSRNRGKGREKKREKMSVRRRKNVCKEIRKYER